MPGAAGRKGHPARPRCHELCVDQALFSAALTSHPARLRCIIGAGPNCSIYASPHTAAARYTSSFGNLPHLLGMKRSESAEALRRAQLSQQQVLRLESIASSAVR